MKHKSFLCIFIAAVLSCTLCCTVMTVPAFKVPAATLERSGTCGENVTWTLDEDGLLTIAGTGAMSSFVNKKPLYYGYKDEVLTVKVEEGVTVIGDKAFDNFTKLTEVTLPDGLENLGNYAFKQCSSLREVHFPKTLKTIGNFCFTHCSRLQNVTLPDSVTDIGESAFVYCESMTEFVVPPKVTTISYSMFYNCRVLSDIIIPETVTSIEGFAFSNTWWLNERRAEDPLVIVNHIVVDGKKCQGEVVIPDSAVALSAGTFYECRGMTGITLGPKINGIPSCCFYDCNGLTSVTLPENIKHIDRGAFWISDTLKEVIILNPDCEICADDDFKTFSYDAEIHGYEGSTAQQYAKKYGRTFVSLTDHPTVKLGDMNRDGRLTAADLSLMKQAIREPVRSDLYQPAADWNGDSEINAEDAHGLLNFLLTSPEQAELKKQTDREYC